METNLKLVAKLSLLLTIAFGLICTRANAQFTLIDFENIPAVYTPVDSFGSLLSGVSLFSSNLWIADSVCDPCFRYLQNRAISAFPDGGAPLSIRFDSPSRDIRMDFGSSYLGASLSIDVWGYYNNQLVFSDIFNTAPGPGGADEVRAQTVGTVDYLYVQRTGGSANLILDNLAFTVIPEPSVLALAIAGVLAFVTAACRIGASSATCC
jgi:hypothetical protein